MPSERAQNTSVYPGFCCCPSFIRPVSRRRSSSPLPAGVSEERDGCPSTVPVPGSQAEQGGLDRALRRRVTPWKSPRGPSPWGGGAGAQARGVRAKLCRRREPPGLAKRSGGSVGLLERADTGLVGRVLLGRLVSCHRIVFFITGQENRGQTGGLFVAFTTSVQR